MPEFKKFCTDTRAPNAPPPEGTVDCQVHVYGDPTIYPSARPGTYPPHADADVNAALRMHHALGIKRGVIVQSTIHGTDHRILFDALAAAGPGYRAVALVDDSVSDQELQRLHEAGVRGARFNFWKQLNMAPRPDAFLRAADRIRPLGWHAKIHAAGDEWLELTDLILRANLPIVVDHMGHPKPGVGVDAPAPSLLREMQRDHGWWIMISNADRFSVEESVWDDALAMVRSFVAAAPDRTIWSTDWPHVQYTKPMPNDAELLEFVYRAIPDPSLLRRVLVENPSRLFRL